MPKEMVIMEEGDTQNLPRLLERNKGSGASLFSLWLNGATTMTTNFPSQVRRVPGRDSFFGKANSALAHKTEVELL